MPKRSSRKRPSRAALKRRLVKAALEMGAIEVRAIDPVAVETGEWVRWKCQFGCGCYGSSRVCPPHSPTPGQTRALLDGYKLALLFEAPPREAKRIAVKLERHLFLEGFYKAFGLGEGPCSLCQTCAFDKGCRHPDRARPAMEACGIDVFATARKHGFSINVVRTHQDPQHYFGLVLVE